MRIISKSTLRAFWRRHPDAEEPLLGHWFSLMGTVLPFEIIAYAI